MDSKTDPMEEMVRGSNLEQFPIDWLVEELMASPVLTRTVLSRYVDRNKDGIVTTKELMIYPEEVGRFGEKEYDRNENY